MAERYGSLTNADCIRMIQEQNNYCGVTKWNKAGYKGKGIVVWDMEQCTDHGCQTHDRIWDVAPEATILNGGISSQSSSTSIERFKIRLQNGEGGEIVEYDPEEFIVKFNVKICTRSIGGVLGYTDRDYPMDKFWLEMQKKYNLIMFNSMGNGGDEQIVKDNLIQILVQACSLYKGKPRRDSYSTTGTTNMNFIDFKGWNSGTSFSTPYLAGKTALLLERYGTDLTQDDIIAYWKDHCEDLDADGYDTYTGFGLPIFGDVDEDYQFPSRKKENEVDEMAKFKDVKDDEWYYNAVDYVTDKGYMNGVGNDEFKPNEPLTRAQLAQVLYNLDKVNKL